MNKLEKILLTAFIATLLLDIRFAILNSQSDRMALLAERIENISYWLHEGEKKTTKLDSAISELKETLYVEGHFRQLNSEVNPRGEDWIYYHFGQ